MKSNNQIKGVQQKRWTSFKLTRTTLLLLLGLQVGSIQLAKSQELTYMKELPKN